MAKKSAVLESANAVTTAEATEVFSSTMSDKDMLNSLGIGEKAATSKQYPELTPAQRAKFDQFLDALGKLSEGKTKELDNGTVTFSITGVKFNSYFRVDPEKGRIYTAAIYKARSFGQPVAHYQDATWDGGERDYRRLVLKVKDALSENSLREVLNGKRPSLEELGLEPLSVVRQTALALDDGQVVNEDDVI